MLGALVLALVVSSAAQAPTVDAAAVDAALNDAAKAIADGRLGAVEPGLREVLDTVTAAHDTRRMARATVLLGGLHFLQGHYPEAADELQRGEQLAIEADDIAVRMQAINSSANTLRELGRLDAALQRFQEWLRLNATLPRPLPDARQVRAIGIVYATMEDMATAESYFRRALASARAADDPGLIAGCLQSLGIVARSRNAAEAIPFFEEAQAQAGRGNFPNLQAEILNSLGATYYQLDRFDEAEARFNASLKLARETKYVTLESQLHERLGLVEFKRGNVEAAAAGLNEANEMLKALGSPPAKRWSVEQELAEIEVARGHTDAALLHYGEAIRLIEQIEQFSLPTEMGRAFPIAAGRNVFSAAVSVMALADRVTPALELADRGRARAFLELVSESRIDLRAALSPAQRAEEEELNKRVSAAKDRPDALAAALDAQQAFYVNLHRSNPGYAELGRPEFATVDRIRRELATGGTTFVEYALGDGESFAWVVTADGVHMARLPKREELKALVTAARTTWTEPVSALTAGRRAAESDAALRKMYNALIAPIRAHVPAGSRLLVVPDGVLAYVPFEALRAPDGRYLLEDHAVAYTQSAAGALAVRARAREQAAAPARALLAVGAPDYGGVPAERRGDLFTALPNARAEVETIARQYPRADRDVLVGPAADEARVKALDLTQYRQLHFAVHGLADELHPEQSGLALGASGTDDGLLRVDEVARLRLRADVVTLSACRTGAGKLFEGEGMLSLGRAFFYAGARRVVASLWDVSDASTADLMTHFYRRLRSGATPDEALRDAKLAMLRGSRTLWRHPYFWSPFVSFQ